MTFRKRDLIGSIYAPTTLFASGAAMLAPALPLYASELEIPVGWIGLLVACQGLGAVASDIPAGLLAARFGGRRAMQLGLLCSALAATGLGLADGPLALAAACVLLGAGGAIWATARLTFITTAAPAPQRGRTIAMIGGVSRLGMAAGPIVGGLLTLELGLRAAFFTHAAIAAATFVVVSLARAEGREPSDTREAARAHAEPTHAEPTGHTGLAATIRTHRAVYLNAGTVAISLATVRSARRILIPLWGAWLGLDLGEIGLVVGLAAAVDMTLFYPVGIVMDRWGRKWTIVPCLALLGVSLALVPLTQGFAGFLAVAMLGGFANGLGSGAVMTMGADLAPKDRPGEFLGVWRLIADTGGIVAPALAGALAQVLTLGSAFLVLAGVGGFGALWMGTRVREGRSPVEAGSDAR